MRYWDTSALVPLIVDGPGTAIARAWLGEDPQVVTWGLTRLEIASAVERRTREGRLTAAQRREVLARVEGLVAAWGEVVDLLAVRARAIPLLARHTLRSADAAQLGAAIVASEANPPSLAFACLDRDLARAAEREGFSVLSWPDVR